MLKGEWGSKLCNKVQDTSPELPGFVINFTDSVSKHVLPRRKEDTSKGEQGVGGVVVGGGGGGGGGGRGGGGGGAESLGVGVTGNGKNRQILQAPLRLGRRCWVSGHIARFGFNVAARGFRIEFDPKTHRRERSELSVTGKIRSNPKTRNSS